MHFLVPQEIFGDTLDLDATRIMRNIGLLPHPKLDMMKNLRFSFLLCFLTCALAFSHCKEKETCDDALQNQDETGVDCGGVCDACATCSDGIRNQNETGVDCGGSCPNQCSIISNLTQYTTANSDIPSDNIRTFYWDGTNLWVATDAGVGVLTSGTWVTYTTTNSSLPSNDVRDFWEGNDGSMWMTTANGVARLNNGTWTIYNSANGAPVELDNAEHIVQALNWTIVTSPGTGFLIYDTFTWTVYTPTNSSLPSANINDVDANPLARHLVFHGGCRPCPVQQLQFLHHQHGQFGIDQRSVDLLDIDWRR
jgi:hypothetical protein